MSAPSIFISYRRDDSGYSAAGIRDRLREAFGPDSVFMDIDSMRLGVDFREQLDHAVGRCDVLLAIIGDSWAGADPANGTRRIDNPADFVRIEIESALRRKIPVVPVLVGRASSPKKNALPESLESLAYNQSAEVRSGVHLNDHLNHLVRELQKILKVAPAPRDRSRAFAIVAALVVILVGASGYAAYRHSATVNAARWRSSLGATVTGLTIEVHYPDTWRAVVAPSSRNADVAFGTARITPDSGALSLQLPDTRGVFLVGIDSDNDGAVTADRFAAKWLTRHANRSLVADAAQQVAGDVYQVALRGIDTSATSVTGMLHLVVRRESTGAQVFWRMFLGDAVAEKDAIRIVMDSSRVRSE